MPRRLTVILLAAAMATGCSTTPKSVRPMTGKELRKFYEGAQDPRRHWITVYRSDRGPVFTNVDRVHPGQVAQMDFLSPARSSEPVIQVDAGRNDRNVVALVDTTAARSWLRMEAVDTLRLVPLGPPAVRYRPVHVNDDIPGYACIATKLRFDQLNMETALLCARGARGPFRPLSRGTNKPEIDLVIGVDMIQAFAFVQMDYHRRVMTFSSSADYKPEDEALIAKVPYQEVNGAIAARGTINGASTLFLIDTAGNFEIAMENAAHEDLDRVSVGELMFSQCYAEPSEDYDLGLLKYPRIGRGLLSNFKVTFSPKEKVIYFERPDQARR